MRTQAVGLPWFERHDYESFRRVLTDRRWHATYDAWLAAAQESFEQAERQGVVAFKANVRSDAFVQWCERNGIDVDNRALLRFASEYARWAFGEQQRH